LASRCGRQSNELGIIMAAVAIFLSIIHTRQTR
jgi:hypothetical protein